MVRKSQRLSSSSKSVPAHKRAASATTISAASTKRSKKGSSSKETRTKSQTLTHQDETGEDSEDEGPSEPSTDEDEASEFGGEADESPPDGSDDVDEYDSEDDKPSRSGRPTPKKGMKAFAGSRSQGQELWRPGVKTGLGPGTQVVIKKPKARAAGKTPYKDETIHPNTMLFLADLKANNDRQWLKSEWELLRLRPVFAATSVPKSCFLRRHNLTVSRRRDRDTSIRGKEGVSRLNYRTHTARPVALFCSRTSPSGTRPAVRRKDKSAVEHSPRLPGSTRARSVTHPLHLHLPAHQSSPCVAPHEDDELTPAGSA